jgi:glycerol uptake facilitator-like aquaporin
MTDPLVRTCDRAECADEFQALQSDAAAPETLTIPDTGFARQQRRLIWYRAVVAEFLCTTCFLFTAFSAAANIKRVYGTQPGLLAVAFAYGLCAIANIYGFAELSGAHFNPAVTFATWVNGDVSNRKAFTFVIAQLLGATTASAAVWGCVLCMHGVFSF